MWALWGTALAGTLVIEDPHGCLREEALQLDLSDHLGDVLVERLDVQLALSPEWQLSIDISDHREPLWARSLRVAAADCEQLGELVVHSVQAGLAALPGGGLRVVPTQRTAEVGVALGASLGVGPRSPRWRAGLGGSAPLWRRLRGVAQARLAGSGVEQVGRGGAQVIGLAGGLGVGVDAPLGEGFVYLEGLGFGGPALVMGRGFDENYHEWLPRAGVEAHGGWAPHGLARVQLVCGLPVVRVAYATPLAVQAEAPFRVGIEVGFAWGAPQE